MLFSCGCTPDPGDKEGWRQWCKVYAICAVVALVVLGIVLLIKAL
jgi:hypothetical protein